MNPDKTTLRALTRGAYDIQKLRIEMGNRICAAYRSKLGLKPSEKEEEDDEANEILKTLRAEFKKITDGVKRELPSLKQFKGSELISTYTELCLLAEYMGLESEEDKHFRRLETVLTEFPLYNEFLSPIKGCGAAMSAVLISEIDISKCEYPSSLWKFCGFDVAPDGAGRSKRKEHLVRRKYTTRTGAESERDSITFNPWIKTKLYVLAGCLIKSGNERYRGIYDNYKHRLMHHAKYGVANEAARKAEMKAKTGHDYYPAKHRHNMAMRYMIKMFLLDLYSFWRAQENLPVAPSYQEAKLGKVHGRAA